MGATIFHRQNEETGEQGAYSMEKEEFKRRPGAKCIMDCYNITEYGALAQDHMVRTGKGNVVQVLGMLETHLPKEREGEVRDFAQKTGWRTGFAAAKPTGKSASGTHGGVMMASKKHLHCTPFAEETGQAGEEKWIHSSGKDWVAIKVRLKGFDLIYIC